MKETNKTYLCKVQKCPMERDVPDEKSAHHQAMCATFGDDFNVVNCEKVESKDGKTLFCEMIVKTDQTPNLSHLPDGFKIVMEVDNV